MSEDSNVLGAKARSSSAVISAKSAEATQSALMPRICRTCSQRSTSRSEHDSARLVIPCSHHWRKTASRLLKSYRETGAATLYGIFRIGVKNVMATETL